MYARFMQLSLDIIIKAFMLVHCLLALLHVLNDGCIHTRWLPRIGALLYREMSKRKRSSLLLACCLQEAGVSSCPARSARCSLRWQLVLNAAGLAR